MRYTMCLRVNVFPVCRIVADGRTYFRSGRVGHTRYRASLFIAAASLLGACDAGSDVRIQALPPLERPTAEARAGLPALQGPWRFAGWEIASEAVAAEVGEPSRPRGFVLENQRIDSLAGSFVHGEMRTPVVGEVRRDGVVSLVAPAGEEAGARFAAGRIVADTLWIELTSLMSPGTLRPGVRWAFVRSNVGQPFMRLPDGRLLRDTVVTLPPADSAAVIGTPAQPPAAAPAPRTPAPPPPAAPVDTPRDPSAVQRTRPQTPAPRDTTPRPQLPPGPEVDIPPAWEGPG